MNAIDISVAQRGLDIAALKRDKQIEYCIIKAGQCDPDGPFMDPSFYDHYSAAKNARLKVGLYWYMKAGPDMILKSVEFLLSHITRLQIELPVFLDLEEPAYYNSICDMSEAWISAMINAGWYPGIYSFYSWWLQKLNSLQLPDSQKWIAFWDPEAPGHCGIWQDGAIWYGQYQVDTDHVYTDYAFIRAQGYNGFEDMKYTDVPKTANYYDAVKYCTDKGYMKGFKDGTFRPDEPLTRAQAAIIIKRITENAIH